MPIRKAIFAQENFYHVYSRGNRKSDIFFEPRDYQRFLEKAEKYRQKYQIDIISYCLLPNHFHFLLKQNSELPISRFIGTLLNSHSRYISIKYGLPKGHLFHGRFGVKRIHNEAGFLQTSRYIHLNSVKEKVLELSFAHRKERSLKKIPKLIQRLRDYKWSSYISYLKPKSETPLKVQSEFLLRLFKSRFGYLSFVESKITFDDLVGLDAF